MIHYGINQSKFTGHGAGWGDKDGGGYGVLHMDSMVLAYMNNGWSTGDGSFCYIATATLRFDWRNLPIDDDLSTLLILRINQDFK